MPQDWASPLPSAEAVVVRPLAAVVVLTYLLLLLTLLPWLYLGAAAVGGAQAAWDLQRGPGRD